MRTFDHLIYALKYRTCASNMKITVCQKTTLCRHPRRITFKKIRIAIHVYARAEESPILFSLTHRNVFEVAAVVFLTASRKTADCCAMDRQLREK